MRLVVRVSVVVVAPGANVEVMRVVVTDVDVSVGHGPSHDLTIDPAKHPTCVPLLDFRGTKRENAITKICARVFMSSFHHIKPCFRTTVVRVMTVMPILYVHREIKKHIRLKYVGYALRERRQWFASSCQCVI